MFTPSSVYEMQETIHGSYSPERESQCCGLMIIHDSAESQDQEPRRGQVEQMSSRAHSITLTATVYNTGGVAAVCSERSSRRQFI